MYAFHLIAKGLTVPFLLEIVMVVLCNRADHYIFMLWFVLLLLLLLLLFFLA